MFLDELAYSDNILQNQTVEMLLDSKKPVIIYGASVYAYVVYKYLTDRGVAVSKFAVDRKYKQADKYIGVEIIEIERIQNDIDNYHVVVGVANYPAVIERFKEKRVNSLIILDVPDFLNIPDPFMDIMFVNDHAEEFQRSFDLLDDELSKNTFIGAINTKLTGDLSFILPNVELDHLYFTGQNFPLKQKETLLDVGGFNGDSIRDFQNITHGKYEHIISLEPFPKMFKQLNKTIEELGIEGKCTAVQIGAWHKKDSLSFAKTEMDIDSKIRRGGEAIIEVDTIDAILENIGRGISYMKFDINGAEYNALIGAKKTIQRDKPFIATKMHVKEDFYRLPILLQINGASKSMGPEINGARVDLFFQSMGPGSIYFFNQWGQGRFIFSSHPGKDAQPLTDPA